MSAVHSSCAPGRASGVCSQSQPIIVDDVYTTNATVEVVAEVLRDVAHHRFRVWCVLKTKRY